jgi:hypothetical protein
MATELQACVWQSGWDDQFSVAFGRLRAKINQTVIFA